MAGKPMPFLLRDVLTYSKNLGDSQKIIKESIGTNSFVFLMSDGKTGGSQIYIKDRERFIVFHPGEQLVDKDKTLPPIDSILYGGHYDDKMISLLSQHRGSVTPQLIMEKLIPEMAMPSNFQNVIYDPKDLRFWVNYAKEPGTRAAELPFTFFDLKEAL